MSAALGAGCVAQVEAPAEEVQTEQAVGPSCTAWQNCYNLCRLRFRCELIPSMCDRLANCLDSCDAQFPFCI